MDLEHTISTFDHFLSSAVKEATHLLRQAIDEQGYESSAVLVLAQVMVQLRQAHMALKKWKG